MADLILPNGWYAVASSEELVAGKPLGIKRFDLELVLWRTSSNDVVALIDLCPHRSVKLSLGKIKNDNCIECPFHGLTFDQSGSCTHIPETGKPAPGIQVKKYIATESHGFVWIWYSTDESLPNGKPEWFTDTVGHFSRLTMAEEINCHITRVIENQLDYAHLGIVHKKTIGRGFDPTAKPRFEFDENKIQVFIRDKKSGSESLIAFKFPNIWLNRIHPRFMITLVFVPIDSGRTRLYLTSYQSFITLPFFGKFLNWVLNLLNSRILSEDTHVIKSHAAGSSITTGASEKLLASDKAIHHFRQIWQRK